MIFEINNKKIDSMFQVENNITLNKILNNLTLEDNNILIVCSSLFFSNIMVDLYDYLSVDILGDISNTIESGNTIINDVNITYKQKKFNLIFLITPSETKVLDVPFKGNKIFNIGFKKTNL